MDKEKLVNDLTEFNILTLYDFMCPIDYLSGITAELLNNRRDDAIKRYQNDTIFHHRIELIVARTLDIIDRNR